MTLTEFSSLYDIPGAIVLLEGKRNVLDADKPQLIKLGSLLAANTKHILFRSGNASGADELFTTGICKVNTKRMQVITPYTGHRKTTNKAHETISLDDVNLLEEPYVIYQSKSNKTTEKLIAPFVAGVNNIATIKAAYIIRDTIKVIGTNSGVPPATVALFYDDLANPGAGGTGHTMKVCEGNNVPYFDQRVWMAWLE